MKFEYGKIYKNLVFRKISHKTKEETKLKFEIGMFKEPGEYAPVDLFIAMYTDNQVAFPMTNRLYNLELISAKERNIFKN